MTRAPAVREAFEAQARWCERLGSPFTARLCAVLARVLDTGTEVGARVLGWPGSPEADALALRLCGGLHALVRQGEAPGLARLYPPAPIPSEAELAAGLTSALAAHGTALEAWLEGPPQTNEVGRAAVLMSGLLVCSAHFPLPIRLFELGASAGLNLRLDRYAHALGGTRAGDPASPVRLQPDWSGGPPPDVPVRIAARTGVDLNPVDPARDGERLLAYVWPDQARRLKQLEAALGLARAEPLKVQKGDAADWLESKLVEPAEAGVARIVMHSVAFSYFPEATQARVRARLERVGAAAEAAAPLVWLRFEKEEGDSEFSLRLRTWPGEDRLLAWTHAHGAWVRWLG